MKTIAVVNPKAASGRVMRQWSHYDRELRRALGEVEVRRTQGPGDGSRVVREAVREGVDRVVVVGGDGTVGEAVNGLFNEAGEPLNPNVVLAYLPAGTGGDFARSIGMSGKSLGGSLLRAEPRRIDVGRATLTGPDGREIIRHFINISSFGSSGLIVDKVNRSPKWMGGKGAFMLGTVRGLLSYQNQRVRLRIDDTFEEEMLINTVAVANGRYFGGSMKIAPHALLNDGVFDVVVLGDIGLGDFVRHSGRLYAGTHLELPYTRELRGKKVTATPLGGEVLIDLDGEQPGRLPVTYEILPGAVSLLAPWEDAEAVGERREAATAS